MSGFRWLPLIVLTLAGNVAAEDRTQVSFSPPGERTPGCIASSMRFPLALVPNLPERADVRFIVANDGSLRDVKVASKNPSLARQIRACVSQCQWYAALDERAVPMAMGVNMQVRFDLEPGKTGDPRSRKPREVRWDRAIAVVEQLSYETIAQDTGPVVRVPQPVSPSSKIAASRP